MSDEDDILKMIVETEDRSSEVLDGVDSRVAEWKEAFTSANDQMADSSVALGATVTTSMSEASEAVAGTTTTVTGLGAAASEAKKEVGELGEELRRAGEHGRGLSHEGTGLGEALEKMGHKARQSFRSVHEGMQLASGSTQQMTMASAKLSTELIAMVSTGNFVVAGLSILATAYGFIEGKAKAAAEAEKKAAEERTKIAEKAASDAKSLETKATAELDAIKKREEKLDADSEATRLQAIGQRITGQEILEERASQHRIETLRKEIDEEKKVRDSLVAQQGSAPGGAKESKARQEAIDQHEVAIKARETAMALEEVVGKREQSVAKAKEEKAAQEEIDKELHAATLEVQKIVNARAAEGEKINESLNKRLEVLKMLNEQQHADEVAKVALKDQLVNLEEVRRRSAAILEIRHQEGLGYTKLAEYSKAVLAAEEARAKLDTAQKAAVEHKKKEDETEKGILQTLHEKALKTTEAIGLQQKINDLAADYQKMAYKTIGLEHQSELMTRIRAQYVKEANQLIAEKQKADEKAAESAIKTNAVMTSDLAVLHERKSVTEELAHAQITGDNNRVEALQKELRALDDQIERAKTLGAIWDQMTQARKDGNEVLYQALQKQWDLEKQILDTKRQQTAAEKDRQQLADTGVGVTGDGRGGTRTNKGIMARRQARAIRLRQKNLASEQRALNSFGEGMSFGMFDSFTLGPDDEVSSLHRGKHDGDMGTGARRKKTETLPGLPDNDFKFPDTPSPEDVKMPGGESAGTLQGTIDALKADAANKTAVADAMKKALADETLVQEKVTEGLGDSVAAINNTKASVDEAKKHVDELATKMNDVADAITDFGGKNGEALVALTSRYSALETAFAEWQKRLDDAMKILNGSHAPAGG